MARSRVIDRDRGYRQVTSRLMGLGNVGLTVGVHEEKGEDIATRATVNEFGSDDGHVPERSFLRSTLDEHQSQYAAEIEKGVDRLLDGVPKRQAFADLGDQVVHDVQLKILSIVPPPNAPSTVANKGHGRTLIESGELFDAIEAQPGFLE